MRKCSRCRIKKNATSDNFHKDKNKKDGYSAICKECKRAEYQKNKEDIKRDLNKKRIEYKEEHRKKREAYRNKNKNAITEREKRYYNKHREELVVKSREYYKDNRERILVQSSEYGKKNPQVSRRSKQKRRALSLRVVDNLTASEWEATKEHFDNACAYCGISEDNHLIIHNEILHQDHFIPINIGGGYTKDNIVPACKSCNSSKNDSDFSEWYVRQTFYSKQKEGYILDYLGYTNNTKQLSIL